MGLDVERYSLAPSGGGCYHHQIDAAEGSCSSPSPATDCGVGEWVPLTVAAADGVERVIAARIDAFVASGRAEEVRSAWKRLLGWPMGF